VVTMNFFIYSIMKRAKKIMRMIYKK
jgi:hypothetical protein